MISSSEDEDENAKDNRMHTRMEKEEIKFMIHGTQFTDPLKYT